MTWLDIDWFAVDAEGKIAHFATGGVGFLPAETGNDLQAADSAFDVLFAANEATSTIIIEEYLPDFSSAHERSQYLASFASMARRGYFSYDVADPSAQRPHPQKFFRASLSVSPHPSFARPASSSVWRSQIPASSIAGHRTLPCRRTSTAICKTSHR